jgi:hypothetical protein
MGSCGTEGRLPGARDAADDAGTAQPRMDPRTTGHRHCCLASILRVCLGLLAVGVAFPSSARADERQAARDEPAGARESLAFEHIEIGIVKKACAIGSICTASWRVEATGRFVHRDGERLFEGTLPAETLASVAALTVSTDIVSELRRPEPCPDRTKVETEIEVGFVPGLVATAQTGDCTAQRLGTLTSTLRRIAKGLFPSSRSSDDVLPQFPQGPPALGWLTPSRRPGPSRVIAPMHRSETLVALAAPRGRAGVLRA